ncbi:MAG: SDR family NAD(P)-dependent oxidoreductase [Luteolibacter sp.]
MSNPQTILVTGGAGFIGSHLCEALLAEGAKVVIIDDFNDFYDVSIKEENIATIRDRITLVRGDLRDVALVESLFEQHRFDKVFHLAARAGVRPSLADPRLYVSTNVDGTLNLLEGCRKTGVKHFVFASSSSVYGVNKKVPFAEDDLIQRTISPYAATKLMGEQLCSNYSHLYGIRCICLRFFTVYGPRQRPDLAISKFTRLILNDQPIDQYGDGSTARDYTFIEDIIAGVMAAGHYTASDFEIVNLGGSAANTLSELIANIEDILGKKAQINYLPDQPGDVPLTYADVSRAKQLFGYSPGTPLRKGLERYVEWVKQRTAGVPTGS